MNTSGATSSIISRKDISLESELTQGKFATMYLAKYYGNHRDAQTVVAKVVKGILIRIYIYIRKIIFNKSNYNKGGKYILICTCTVKIASDRAPFKR